jgi:hypothetical protein
METLGFVSAVLGIVAAFLNRKRILVVRYESGRYTGGPVVAHRANGTIGKRFKRLCAALGIAISMPMLEAVTGADLKEMLIWPFGICLLVAAYQMVAIVILVLARLLR